MNCNRRGGGVEDQAPRYDDVIDVMNFKIEFIIPLGPTYRNHNGVRPSRHRPGIL